MNYLRYLLLTCIGTLLLTASFNWFIDPYAMYWSSTINGINHKKTEAGNRVRHSKRFVLAKTKPSILIVGNSRVEMGLNPKHKAFNHLTYNYGIPGQKLYRQIENTLYEIEHNENLSHIIMSLDYVDFLHSQAVQQQTIETLNWRDAPSPLTNPISDYKSHLSMLVSLNTLVDSFLTIINQNRLSSTTTALGFNTAQSYFPIIKHEGKEALFSQKLQELTTRLAGTQMRFSSQHWPPFSTNFTELQTLIDTANAHNIKVSLFINPYHMSYHHLLAELGYWPNYQQWKTRLSQFVQLQQDETLITALDFSGFNEITSEAVGLNQPHQPMKWFWEPAHYNERLGNLMIPLLLKLNSKPSHLVKDLLMENIEDINTEDNIGLAQSKVQWDVLKQQINVKIP